MRGERKREKHTKAETESVDVCEREGEDRLLKASDAFSSSCNCRDDWPGLLPVEGKRLLVPCSGSSRIIMAGVVKLWLAAMMALSAGARSTPDPDTAPDTGTDADTDPGRASATARDTDSAMATLAAYSWERTMSGGVDMEAEAEVETGVEPRWALTASDALVAVVGSSGRPGEPSACVKDTSANCCEREEW